MDQLSNIKHCLSQSLLLFLLTITLIGCNQTSRPLEVSTPQTTSQPDETETSDFTKEIPPEVIIRNPEQYQLALNAMTAKDFETAKYLFESFKNENPHLSGSYLNLAIIELQKNQLSLAETLVSEAIKINPSRAQAFNLRAQIQLKIGQVKAARNDLQKALTLNPQYSIAHYNIALLYDIYLQDVDLAIEHYTKYLNLIDKDDKETRKWIKHLKGSIKNG